MMRGVVCFADPILPNGYLSALWQRAMIWKSASVVTIHVPKLLAQVRLTLVCLHKRHVFLLIAPNTATCLDV